MQTTSSPSSGLTESLLIWPFQQTASMTAFSSLSEEYMCPDPATEMRESSPRTRTRPKFSSKVFFKEKASSPTENSGTFDLGVSDSLMAYDMIFEI